MEFQTRSEVNGVAHYLSLDAALGAAINDPTVWKISFTISETKERVRLVRRGIDWIYEPLMV